MITVIISCVIYLIYNIFCLYKFGIPNSLSETYYLLDNRYGKGWLFSVMIYIVIVLLLPSWIIISEGISVQFLSFIAPASLLFVGTAPAFKASKLEDKVHTISAYVAAICSLLWIIFATQLWWVIFIWFSIIGVIALVTKSNKTSYIYWLEQIVLFSVFNALFIF